MVVYENLSRFNVPVSSEVECHTYEEADTLLAELMLPKLTPSRNWSFVPLTRTYFCCLSSSTKAYQLAPFSVLEEAVIYAIDKHSDALPGDTRLMVVTSSNLNQFSKLSHRQTHTPV